MEAFKTQFTMSGVPTDVSVQVTGNDIFACTLNLADFFDGGEFEGSAQEPDFTLKRLDNDEWVTVGNSRVTLTQHDIDNLGKAIATDYLHI